MVEVLPGVEAQRLRRLRREEYERMVEIGLFEGEHVELLRGMLVTMSPQGAPHAAKIGRLNMVLVPALVGRAIVRVQCPLALDDSEPEPDIAVVRPGDYETGHPTEAFLVVEVAETSVHIDRGLKSQLYARAGIPEYWLVNLPEGVVEVHREPSGGAYRSVTRHRSGEALRLLAFPDVEVRLDEILGSARHAET